MLRQLLTSILLFVLLLVMTGNFWSPQPDPIGPPANGAKGGKAVIAPLTLLLSR